MTELFPADLAVSVSLLLIAVSALTSFITSAAGLGGGAVMLAVMAVLLPAPAIIPVHGAVQIGSNLSRAVLMRKHIQRDILLPFIAGSVIGALVGGVTVVRLSPAVLKLGLGCFILWSVWGPAVRAAGRLAVIGTGIVSTFLTMFFGATGTFVSAMVKTLKLGRLEHSATQAACMVAQHTIKVAVFGLLGFAYGQYLFLVAAMIVSGFIGVLIGTRVLFRMNDAIFHRTLAVILTLLAGKLIYDGLTAW